MSAQFGFVNIIKTTECSATSGGSGLLRGLLVLIVVGLLGSAGYHLLDSALRGMAATTAEVNRVIGWAVAVVLVLTATTAAVWVLLARRRILREAPTVAAFTAATDRALAARRHAALTVATTPSTNREVGPAPPVKVTAARIKAVGS